MDYIRYNKGETMFITTYNVLGTGLDKYHPNRTNDRTDILMDKIMDLISMKGNILCLQEVSRDIYEKLELMFGDECKIIYAPYGNKQNNYMGVVIMYYKKDFRLLDLHIFKPSQLLEKTKKPKLSCWETLMFSLSEKNIDENKLKVFDQIEVENKIARKWNDVILLKLIDDDDKQFWVSNVHIPCIFDYPRSQELFIELMMDKLLELIDDRPLYICGDFNIQPDGDVYKFMIDNYGLQDLTWQIESSNYCYTEKFGEFEGKLDYIFKCSNSDNTDEDSEDHSYDHDIVRLTIKYYKSKEPEHDEISDDIEYELEYPVYSEDSEEDQLEYYQPNDIDPSDHGAIIVELV